MAGTPPDAELFKSDKKESWENNPETMNDEKALSRSPPASKYKNEQTEADEDSEADDAIERSPKSCECDSDINSSSSTPKCKMQKAQKWQDRVLALHNKKKQGAECTGDESHCNSSLTDEKSPVTEDEHETVTESPQSAVHEEQEQEQEQQETAARSSGFVEYEEAERRNGRTTLDDNTVNEADDIVKHFSDHSSEEDPETAEDVAAEAEDIMSGFSGSKESSSSSSSEAEANRDPESDSESEDNEIGELSSGPREFAMGLGGSSVSDSSSSDEGVLMHAMNSDDDGDIGLDELFETAAALEVTLETESSAMEAALAEQELYDHNNNNNNHHNHSNNDDPTSPRTSSQESEFDSLDVESNSSLSCSTIEEEHTENIEEEQTTIETEEQTTEDGDGEGEDEGEDDDDDDDDDDDGNSEEPDTASDQKKKPKQSKKAAAAAGVASTAASTTPATATTPAASSPPSPFSAPRSFQPSIQALAGLTMYSKSRTLLYDSDDEEAGGGSAFNDGASPMPWFAAVPYSTGKWKQTEDGMSVTSDDISYEVSGEPILKPGHQLPYTVVKRKPPPISKTKNPRRKHWFVVALGILLLLILAIFLGIWLSSSSGTATATDFSANIDEADILDMEATSTANPSSSTSSTTSSSYTATETATATSDGLVVDFESTAVFEGKDGGDRFGSDISMTQDGRFMATLSDSSTNPVRAFVRNGKNWLPLSDLPDDGSTSASVSSLSYGASVATATTENGDLVVAASSPNQIDFYRFVDGTGWTSFGDPLYWNAPRGISHTSMDLSSDASKLVLGLVDAAGTTISVSVYQYDDYKQKWGTPTEIDPIVYRDASRRSVNVEEGTILSMSVTLSGDGNVLTIEEWDVGSPQIIVQSFEWDGGYYSTWSPMGDPIEFPSGPVSVALSSNGYRKAVVANHPGTGSVFDWDGYEWKAMGGNAEHGFLPGGSDVALARSGTRILIGDASMNKVSVYDFQDDYRHYYTTEEWSAWMPTKSIWGGTPGDDNNTGGRFGASVSMDGTGSILGIGAPFDGEKDHFGRVAIYGRS